MLIASALLREIRDELFRRLAPREAGAYRVLAAARHWYRLRESAMTQASWPYVDDALDARLSAEMELCDALAADARLSRRL